MILRNDSRELLAQGFHSAKMKNVGKEELKKEVDGTYIESKGTSTILAKNKKSVCTGFFLSCCVNLRIVGS